LRVIADVIFPAFAAPYFSPLLLPIAGAAAIGTELFVFWRYNREVPFGRILSRVILANLVSWFVGVIIAFLLPSGLGTRPVPSRGGQISIVTTGPHWNTLAIIAFFLACALSILIEYFVLRRFQTREFPFHTLGASTAYANIFGYVALALAVWINLRYLL
jgi:hypothetical protein